MRRIPLLAMSFLVMVGACTADSRSPSQNAEAPDISEVGESLRVGREDKCAGDAKAPMNGPTRRVRIEITPCRVESGETPTAVLTNIGRAPLGYGPGFVLERRTAHAWRWINRRQAFPLPLFRLPAGERSDPEQIAVYFSTLQPVELKPGLYRVSKGVQLGQGVQPPTLTVHARFRVID